jgi:diguanylate cyclase (GGDEF)-like protein/PAS domain S-box-containing protein
MNLLDMRTVIFSYGISNLICMIVMIALWRQNHQKFAGLGFWLADFSLQFIALVLLVPRGMIPDFLSMTVSNAMVVGGTILLYIGLEHFAGKRGPQLHNYILLVVFILVHIYFVLVFPSLTVRNILFSLALLILCSQCAWLMLRRVDPEKRLITSGVGYVLIVFCLVSIARLIVDLTIPSGNDFFHSNVYDTLVLMTYQMLFILLMLSLFMMVNHRLSTDLESDIMARKQAEEALRRREQEFKTLVENSPDAITRFDREGHYQYVNPARAWYFGRSVSEIQGKTVWDLLGPDEVGEGKIADEALKGIFENPKEFTVEYETKTPDGMRWVQSRGTPEFAEDCSVESVLVVTRDITERKQMEDALRQSEEKFSKAFQSSPDAMLITRLHNGHFVEVNEGFCRLTGYTREEALSSSTIDLGLWPNLQDRERIVAELQQNHGIHEYELDFRIKSGRILNCLYSGEIIQLGNEAHVLSVVHDITERKQMEKTLRGSEEKHRIIVQTAMDGFWQMDMQGNFVYVNDAYCQMSGYSEQELLSMKISDLDVAETPDITATHIQKVLAQGQDRFETRHRRKDGSVFDVEISAQYRDGQFVAFLRNITERNHTDEIVRLRLRLWEYAISHSIDELMQKALDEIGDLTDSPIGFYHFVEEDQNTLSLQTWSTRTLAEFCRAEGKGLHYPISEAGVWVDCVRERKPVIHNDYSSLPHRKGLPAGHAEVVRELVVPTMRNGRVVAILGVGNKLTDYDEKDVELVSYIADIIWTIVEQKRSNEQIRQLNARLEQLAMTDDLTGLFNRRSFFKRGAEEIKRSQRYQFPLSLLMMDIDEFKTVNDTYGHDAGDRILCLVADTLRLHSREVDMVVRLGGEEFGILLPNTEEADAIILAERLRLAVEGATGSIQDQQVGVTTSIGVAVFGKEIQNIDHLLKNADTAMYQAKNQGRNRVVVFNGKN